MDVFEYLIKSPRSQPTYFDEFNGDLFRDFEDCLF